MAVQQIVRRITRSEVYTRLLLGMAVGLFGCPLLLEDEFSVGSFFQPDAGNPCIGSTCHVPHSSLGGSAGEGSEDAGGAAGQAGAASGTGGSTAGIGGSSGASGGSGLGGGVSSGGSAGEGSSGAGSTAGSSGGGSAGAGSAGAGGNEGEACWTLELDDGTHDSTTNCLGIAGTNVVKKDVKTSLTLSYEDGDPCLTGTIAAAPDWGATFELEFAPEDGTWNATAANVTGFEFVYRGPQKPPQIKTIYKMEGSDADYCRFITPGTNTVTFSATEKCTNGYQPPTLDPTVLDELILAILPQGGSSYPVDFCVQIRALD